MTTSPPQDLTCLHFGTRAYQEKDRVAGTDWGSPNKDSPNPSISFFPEWFVFQGYGDSPHECDCRDVTLNSVGLADPGGAEWKGVGDCTGGSSSWGCCGCGIMSWNQDPANKSKCCDPSLPPGDPTQNSAVHCDPAWCPFSPQCEQDPTTEAWCTNNTDDVNCLNICLQYNTQEAVTDKSRPKYCNEFMKNYCIKHQNDSRDNQDLCACITSSTPDVICVSAACTNAGSAWVSDEMYSREGNCGTICLQYINGETSNGNVNINGNDFKQACGNTYTGGGNNNGTNSWWGWITGNNVNSPGAAPPDTTVHHWWGQWVQEPNATFGRKFSITGIVVLIVAGLLALSLIIMVLRFVLGIRSPPATNNPPKISDTTK